MMTVSDYQINSVIKTYMKNMKTRIGGAGKTYEAPHEEDDVNISDEGMKKILFERIGEKMTERLKRHEQKR
jgi:hypothetical protein